MFQRLLIVASKIHEYPLGFQIVSMRESKQIVPIWVMVATSVLCVVAIADLPYGFYLFLRWVVCTVSLFSAFQMHRVNRNHWAWILGVVAVLFNPFIPMHFEKATWRVIDGIVGVVFFCLLHSVMKSKSKNIE